MNIDLSSPLKLSDLISAGFSLCAFIVSFISIVYVYIQWQAQKRQQRLDFHLKINEINRELIAMAFSDKELLNLLNGQEIQDKEQQKRYIQMWLNQSLFMWLGKQAGVIEDSAWYSLRRDIEKFVNIPSTNNHWWSVSTYYPPEFANFINGLVKDKNKDHSL
jgi:hypothetical protein